MKKNLLTLFATGAIGLASVPLWGQTTDNASAQFYATRDSIDSEIASVVRKMENRMFQDPRAPRFLLVSKNNKFALGIGGYARLVNGVEFKGIINTTTDEGFQPGSISVPSGNLPRAQYRLSAATSKIFVKMVGRTKRLGDISTYIGMDFEGNNYTPRLHQAYMTIGGFLLGEAWSTMSDLNAIPPTIDFAGPNGMILTRNPQIRYARTFAKERFKFGIATEFPQVNATYDPYTEPTFQAVPDVIGYLQVNWGAQKNSHFRVSGILRNMSYRDVVDSDFNMDQGWGVQASGLWNMGSKVTLFYQGVYGKGIASYLNDLSLFNLDLVPNAQRMGYLEKTPMWGMYAGLQYNFTKAVYMSATYSQSRFYGKEGYTPPRGTYKYGQYFVTNLFWDITQDCTMAIEYLWGSKHVFGCESGKANRINLMVQYNF